MHDPTPYRMHSQLTLNDLGSDGNGVYTRASLYTLSMQLNCETDQHHYDVNS
jgi:hypothetical protein